jgi:undecaprenyl-diphosphatase
MLSALRRIVSEVKPQELWIMVPGLVIAVGIFTFVQIVDGVKEGETRTFDEWLLLELRRADDPGRPIGPGWLPEAGRDLTALGSTVVLVLVVASVVGLLILQRKLHMAWLVVAASVGGVILSTVMKEAFARERPNVVPHLMDVFTPSFPSGHAMMSAAVYLTLGALLARSVTGWQSRVFCVFIAVVLTVLVGISRVYLGVHYPTDVLAGWTAGAIWAMLCWAVALWLQRRGAVETPAG